MAEGVMNARNDALVGQVSSYSIDSEQARMFEEAVSKFELRDPRGQLETDQLD
jgi:hypothetical protein